MLSHTHFGEVLLKSHAHLDPQRFSCSAARCHADLMALGIILNVTHIHSSRFYLKTPDPSEGHTLNFHEFRLCHLRRRQSID